MFFFQARRDIWLLSNAHFIVHTDHATLRHFPTQPNLTRRQARWMELFQEYDFDFKYKPGKDSIVPNALSRRPDYKWTTEDLFQLHSLVIVIDPDTKRQFQELYPRTPPPAWTTSRPVPELLPRESVPSRRWLTLDSHRWICSSVCTSRPQSTHSDSP